MRAEIPKARTYLGYTLRPYTVKFRWEVTGQFSPPANGHTASVGVADIRSLKEAMKQAREFEAEFGRAGPRRVKRDLT